MGMHIREANKAYERWLSQRLPLLPADLNLKHQRMAEGAFEFLRATFYRWAQVWPRVCPELAGAPAVLGVGDLHVENFGTWRDSEGRLVWGVNDFDEACRLPYPNDLVRLAVSAELAVRQNRLSCELNGICKTLLDGYCEALNSGGKPIVLAEHHPWLRDLANSKLREPFRYWQKLKAWPVCKSVPREVKDLLRRALPEAGLPFRVVHRQAGLGSLGRRRFTALAYWRGGLVAREVKELVASAWVWEKSKGPKGRIVYDEIIGKAVRMADPCLALRGRWLIRRLAPDCSRIELASLPKAGEELKLLHAMGWETANIHLAHGAAVRGVRKDLSRRNPKWLREAAGTMTKAVVADWKEWRGGR
jgi:hypothetical protein